MHLSHLPLAILWYNHVISWRFVLAHSLFFRGRPNFTSIIFVFRITGALESPRLSYRTKIFE